MDAYIERESDLIPLIDKANVGNLPVLLICRGISDYCAKNLKNIILKNKVYLYPYVAKFSNEDPFLFDDISKSLNISMINAEVGDNIIKNSVDKSKIKSLKVSSNKIYCSVENKNVLKEINKKLSAGADDSLRQYLFMRKKRLSTNIVDITIPHTQTQFLYEIQNLIKCYNIITIYGLIKDKENNVYSKKEIEYSQLLKKRFLDTFKNIGLVVRENELH